MRRLLFVLGILVVTAGIGGPAQAQNYPWCAVLNMGDAAYNCGFDTFEECRTSLSGIGGFCQKNTTYVPPAATDLLPAPAAAAAPLAPTPK